MYFSFHIKKVLKTVILFFALIAFNLNLTAQSKIIVNGFVNNSKNQKIIGATLLIKINDDSFSIVTDTLGEYSFEVITGNVEIIVRQLGYKNSPFKENLFKNRTLKFTLEEENPTLKEVVILNSSKKLISKSLGGKISFNPQNLAIIPSISGTIDIVKLLQLIPGVQNSGDANGYLYVRGGEPGHNLMLYADTPVYGMAHLLGVFPFYNPEHINEVQFDKSNSDAKYGGRLSSTVQAIPSKEVSKEMTFQGVIGLLATQLSFSAPIGTKTSIYLSGRKTYIDEILSTLLNSQNQNNDVSSLKYGFSDFNFTFVNKFSKKSLFTVDSFVSEDVLKMNDSKLTLNSNLKWRNITFSPTWNYKLSESITMTNSLYLTRYDNKLDIEQSSYQMKIASYVQDIGFSSVIKYYVKNVAFESGFQYAHHDLQPQKIEISNLSNSTIDKQDNQIIANNAAIFISAKPKFSDNLYAELGLRLNYYLPSDNSKKLLRLEPRFLLQYKFNSMVSTFVSYTRQNQYLNLVTTSSVGIPTDFWVASSDGIPSQSSNEFSLGSYWVISKTYNCSLNGFYRSMKRLIEYPYGVTQFNEITSLKNDILIGKGESYGFEWMLKKDSGKFKGWLSYTLSWSARHFDGLNNGEPFYAKFDRRHNLAIVGIYDFNKKWNFGLTQMFSSGNRYTMPTSWYFINNNPVKEYSNYNNAKMSNYLRTDLSVNYWFIKTTKKESSLNFSIFNTFNIDNPIYVFLNVTVSENKQSISVKPEEKKLYSILPSISWRFKF